MANYKVLSSKIILKSMYNIVQPKMILIADPYYYNEEDRWLNKNRGFQYDITKFKEKNYSACLLTQNNIKYRATDSSINFTTINQAEIIITNHLKLIQNLGKNDESDATDANYKNWNLLFTHTNKYEVIVDDNCQLFKYDFRSFKGYGSYRLHPDNKSLKIVLKVIDNQISYSEFTKMIKKLFLPSIDDD